MTLRLSMILMGMKQGFRVNSNIKYNKKNCRQIDTVSRWGGEEFLIMLTNTPIEGAKILSERIRKEIKEFDFNYKEHKIKCTITLGVVEVNSNISLEENISLADKAMYEGKNLGKDCSVVSTMKGLKRYKLTL